MDKRTRIFATSIIVAVWTFAALRQAVRQRLCVRCMYLQPSIKAWIAMLCVLSMRG